MLIKLTLAQKYFNSTISVLSHWVLKINYGLINAGGSLLSLRANTWKPRIFIIAA